MSRSRTRCSGPSSKEDQAADHLISSGVAGSADGVALRHSSRGLEVESFTEERDGLRKRTICDAKSAFYDACLTADVVCEIEDRRLTLA